VKRRYIYHRGESIEVDRPQDEVTKLLDAFDRPACIAAYIEELTSEPPPPLIYHYCSADAGEKILTSGKLWCTDVFSLNDTSEIRHGVRIACELLDTAARRAVLGRVELFAREVIKELRDRVEESANFFVCCLGIEGDDLTQWRAYADDGKGVALGFDAAELERTFLAEAPNNHSSFPLSYDNERMRCIQAQLVADTVKILYAAGDVMTRDQLVRLCVRFSVNVIHCATFFKHEGFASESEYRLMQVFRADEAVPDVLHRGVAASPTRYREYDWRTRSVSALRRVIVGPSADREATTRLVEDFKHRYLPRDNLLEVQYSELPYRG
jgi:hypothetical protein